MDDSEIIKLYLRRDETAIAHTQSKYGTRLRGIARGVTSDSCSAEEAENDTYLKTWESIPPHEPYDGFFTYLARIIRNISLNIIRSRGAAKRRAEVVELTAEMEQCIPDPTLVETEFDARLLSEAISAFLDGLTAEKRDIFMRRYWFLDSPEAIAKRFGKPRGSINVTLYRLREELKSHLENEDISI